MPNGNPKSNPSRMYQNKKELWRRFGVEYINPKSILINTGSFNYRYKDDTDNGPKNKNSPVAAQKHKKTDFNKDRSLNALDKEILFGNKTAINPTISGIASNSSLYKGNTNNVQQTIENFLELTKNKSSFLALDIETLGDINKAPGIFNPSEIFIQNMIYQRNKRKVKKLVRADSGIKLMIRPDDKVANEMWRLLQRVKKAGQSNELITLTETEHRTIIDLMRYAQDAVEINGKIFGGAQISSNTIRIGGQPINLFGVANQHALFGANLNENLAALSPSQLAKYIYLAESGLKTLRTQGVDASVAGQVLSNYIQSSKSNFLVGQNQTNFDVPTLTKFFSQQGINIELPKKQVDLFSLTKILYPVAADLHDEIYEISGITRQQSQKISHALESILDSFGQPKQTHNAFMDTMQTVFAFDKMNNPILTKAIYDALSNTTPSMFDDITKLSYSRNPKMNIKKGSVLFAYRGANQTTLGGFSRSYEHLVGKKIEHSFGDFVITKNSFYIVKDIWKMDKQSFIDSNGEDALKSFGEKLGEEIFGITLFDNLNKRTAVITAATQEDLIGKIHGFGMNASLLDNQTREKIYQSNITDRARRAYSELFEVGEGRGLYKARKYYQAAEALKESGITRKEQLTNRVLKKHGIESKAQQRDFRNMFDRLVSESSQMLNIIDKIDKANFAQKDLLWHMINKEIDPYKTKMETTFVNARSAHILNRANNGYSAVDLTSIESARSSVYSVIKMNVGDNFIDANTRNAARSRYFEDIVEDLIMGQIITNKDRESIFTAGDTLEAKITRMAQILSTSDKTLIKDLEVESMNARPEITIGGKSLSDEILNDKVNELIGFLNDISIKDKNKASIKMQLLNKLDENQVLRDIFQFLPESERKARRTELLARLAEAAADLQSAFHYKGIETAWTMKGNVLQMVLYDKSDASSVNKALLNNEIASKALYIDLPTFDKHGNIVVGGGTKLAQKVIKKKWSRDPSENQFVMFDALDLVKEKIIQNSTFIAETISYGDINQANRRARKAQSMALEDLAGATRAIDRSDIDYGDGNLVYSIEDWVKQKGIVINNLIQGGHLGPKTSLERMTGSEIFTLYSEILPSFLKAHPELGISPEDISIVGTRESWALSGKLSTFDVRKLQPFGFFTKGIRPNLIQNQAVLALSDESVTALARLSNRKGSKVVLNGLTITESKLKFHTETAWESNTGATSVGVVMDDKNLNKLLEVAARRAESAGDIATAAKLRAKTVRAPRTYEQGMILAEDFAKSLSGFTTKTFKVNAKDLTEEFEDILKDFHHFGSVSIYENIKIAEGQKYGEKYRTTLDVSKSRAGEAVLYGVNQENGIYTFNFAFKQGIDIGSKQLIEAEKGTTHDIYTRQEMDYMFGKDTNVSYIYNTNIMSHEDYGAYLTGMYNRAIYEASKQGKSEDEIKTLTKYILGFDVRFIKDPYGFSHAVIPDYIGDSDNGILQSELIEQMGKFYAALGLKEQQTFGYYRDADGKRQAIRGRVEMNEVRLSSSDSSTRVADDFGIGRGAKFSEKEWWALDEQGLIYKNPLHKSSTILDASGNKVNNLTRVGQWLEDASSTAGRRSDIAQAKGRIQTIADVIRPGERRLDQMKSTRSFAALHDANLGLYTEESIRNTIFDPSLYFTDNGYIKEDAGFYLSLGTSVNINVGIGSKDIRNIDSIWIDTQKLMVTDEGTLMLDDTQKSLKSLFQVVSAYEEKYNRTKDSLEDRLKTNWDSLGDKELEEAIHSKSDMRLLIAKRTQEYLEKIGEDLTSKDGSVFDRVMSSRLSTSGMFEAAMVSPEQYLEGGKLQDELGTLFISEKRAKEIFSDLNRVVRDSSGEVMRTADGKTMTVKRMLETEGMYGYVQRFPNLHAKTLGAIKIKLSSEVEGNTAHLDPVTAAWLGMDTDGDKIAAAIAYNNKLNPHGLDKDKISRFWETQAELRKAHDARYKASASSLDDGLYGIFNARIAIKEINEATKKGKFSKHNLPVASILDPKFRKFVDSVAFSEDDGNLVSRIAKTEIGKFSNISYKMRTISQSTYLELANRAKEAGDDAAYRDYLVKHVQIAEFGRILEQDFISAKKIEGTAEILTVAEELQNMFYHKGTFDKERAKFLFEQIGIDDSKINVGKIITNENGEEVVERMFNIDQMLDAVQELYDATQGLVGGDAFRMGTQSGIKSYRQGESKLNIILDQFMGEPDEIEALNKYRALQILDAGKAEHYLEETSKRKKLIIQRLEHAREVAASTSTDQVQQTASYIINVANDVLANATTSESAIGQTAEAVLESIAEANATAAKPTAMKTLGVASAVYAAVSIGASAMKAIQSPDVKPEELYVPARQAVRQAEEMIGGGYSIRAYGSISGDTEAVGEALNEWSKNKGGKVHASINITDNTKDFTPDFLESLFNATLG